MASPLSVQLSVPDFRSARCISSNEALPRRIVRACIDLNMPVLLDILLRCLMWLAKALASPVKAPSAVFCELDQ